MQDGATRRRLSFILVSAVSIMFLSDIYVAIMYDLKFFVLCQLIVDKEKVNLFIKCQKSYVK